MNVTWNPSSISVSTVQHAENEVALAILAMPQTEVDLWKKHGDSYGYVFYLGRAV
ncbi:MAG: hypothetical protein KDA80_18320 [Planctomycetaceae bacterium]|nr:hypothetical protein [Planctomycetaceae bacterium]